MVFRILWHLFKLFAIIEKNNLKEALMLKTILFDLDGTLLPMELDQFLHAYFHSLGAYLKDLIYPKSLFQYLDVATEAMVNNSGDLTNEQVFKNIFFSFIKEDPTLYMDRFDRFYTEEFPKIQSAVGFSSIMQKSVLMLKQKGYELVVATNPLFPRSAIEHRIQWAGFTPKDFIHITSYEQCHFSKPQENYFKEILKDIQRKPEDCLMVGNDVQEDLAAGELGIKTFLIMDHMIHRSDEKIPADFTGTYEDFYTFVNKLPIVNKERKW